MPRAYRLEDDGASGLALRKQYAKGRGDVVERHQRAIVALEKRQADGTTLPPLQPRIAEQLIASHRKAIRRHASGLDAVAPAVNIVAPVARRVAREDRRRARKAKAQD